VQDLSNPKRLMILALLAKKEMSVGEIAEVISVPLSNVSQHLSLLKAQSLVQTRKGWTDRLLQPGRPEDHRGVHASSGPSCWTR